MIRAENLSMHYGPVEALRNVSFKVEQGEIVGLLGPNGAGKSTTMKILTTYLTPSKGTAKVAGMDIRENPLGVRKAIGYLPEVLPLYMDMEVRTYLEFVAKARGLSGAALKERVNTVIDKVALRPMFRKIIRELSKGYKQRTGLAQALIHDPEIVILDEPTSGLDPHQILEIRELIRELAHNKTVMISTHILQEIEAIADRIVIISRGQIAGDGSLEELRAKAQQDDRLAITIKGSQEELQRLLSGMDGARKVVFTGAKEGYASFDVHGKLGSNLWKEAGVLARAKSWEVRELRDKPLGLEETFLALTARGGAHAGESRE